MLLLPMTAAKPRAACALTPPSSLVHEVLSQAVVHLGAACCVGTMCTYHTQVAEVPKAGVRARCALFSSLMTSIVMCFTQQDNIRQSSAGACVSAPLRQGLQLVLVAFT